MGSLQKTICSSVKKKKTVREHVNIVEKECLWFAIHLVILGILSSITLPLWCFVSCALFDILFISDLFL